MPVPARPLSRGSDSAVLAAASGGDLVLLFLLAFLLALRLTAGVAFGQGVEGPQLLALFLPVPLAERGVALVLSGLFQSEPLRLAPGIPLVFVALYVLGPLIARTGTKTVTINTTAAGGNASLLTLVD